MIFLAACICWAIGMNYVRSLWEFMAISAFVVACLYFLLQAGA